MVFHDCQTDHECTAMMREQKRGSKEGRKRTEENENEKEKERKWTRNWSRKQRNEREKRHYHIREIKRNYWGDAHAMRAWFPWCRIVRHTSKLIVRTSDAYGTVCVRLCDNVWISVLRAKVRCGRELIPNFCTKNNVKLLLKSKPRRCGTVSGGQGRRMWERCVCWGEGGGHCRSDSSSWRSRMALRRLIKAVGRGYLFLFRFWLWSKEWCPDYILWPVHARGLHLFVFIFLSVRFYDLPHFEHIGSSCPQENSRSSTDLTSQRVSR